MPAARRSSSKKAAKPEEPVVAEVAEAEAVLEAEEAKQRLVMRSIGGGTHTKPGSATTGVTVMTVGHASIRPGSASPGAV